jgi:Tol biopolymer transport system component/predicted Ser/Thr protein kinase
MGLKAGDRLGSFDVLGPIGAGGMGEVYRARDTRLGREVALKVLPEALAEDRERLSRFEQEARAASALNHPNIVTIHEIGRDGETTFIAMELVDGKTLRELAASGPMPVRKILQYAAQVAEGLAKAHGAGIVHRDLKPENVMVTKDGFVKILDFGLAKLVEAGSDGASAMPTLGKPETHPGTVLGTVGYMSPEQASGEPLDYRSDQFSLGSILYELATGKKPFQRKTAAETLSAIIREEPEAVAKLRPELPPPVRWIVERCLAKDREERFASTRDLARDLAGVRDHISEVSSGAEAMLTSTGKLRRRSLPLVAALALILAGLAGGFAAKSALSGAKPAAPTFRRLTFRQGNLGNARFAPDGRTVVYGGRWVGETRGPGARLYRIHVGNPESEPFDFPADILAVSSSNELAIVEDLKPNGGGTLARVPMSGGTPRAVLEHVTYAGADFTPDGKELAVARIVDGKRRLEFPIGKVLVPEGVSGPRISPDGRSIAFWERTATLGAVAVIDRSGGSKRVLSGGWRFPEGSAACWSPDGREVWFTASRLGETDALWAVDLSGKVRLLIRVPGHLELDDVSREGHALVNHHTITHSVRVASADAPTDHEVSWLDASVLNDLSADGKTLLLTERGEGSGSGSVMYLRSTDGSPAVKLGEGFGQALSPDGRWVLAYHQPGDGKAGRLSLLPTGAGESRPLAGDGFVDYSSSAWLPDGKGVVFGARKADGVSGVYVQAVPDGKPRPVGPERTRLSRPGHPVSPDGKYVVGIQGGQALLVPIDGGPARALAGISPDEHVAQWSADSRSLYVYRASDRPLKIWLHEIDSGKRLLWKEFPLDESSGFIQILPTPDGSTWAYSGRQVLSELYLIEGLR